MTISPAYADGTVTVRGTAFPGGREAQLTMVGCSALYARTAEVPVPRIVAGDAALGERSLGYDLAGGNAVGSLHYVDSMASTGTAGLAVTAPDGTSGVAYAGFQSPDDAGTTLLWIGRAPLSVGAGGWQRVDAIGLTYDWTQYDMSTQAAVASGPIGTVAGFAATHGGDGAGFFSIGFGCDGRPFQVDALRIGGTTYDLEGLATVTRVEGASRTIDLGGSVELTGSVRTGAGDRVPRATLLLEAREAGSSDWTTVGVFGAAESDPTATVTPEVRTTYRWRFVSRPLAEGSGSSEVTIDVARTVSAALRGDAVTGTVGPAAADTRVTLWRLDGERRVEVASTRTDGDGGYRFEGDVLTNGRYVVTAPGEGGGLAAGESAVLVVTGHGAPEEPAAQQSQQSAQQQSAQQQPAQQQPGKKPEKKPGTRPSGGAGTFSVVSR